MVRDVKKLPLEIKGNEMRRKNILMVTISIYWNFLIWLTRLTYADFVWKWASSPKNPAEKSEMNGNEGKRRGD